VEARMTVAASETAALGLEARPASVRVGRIFIHLAIFSVIVGVWEAASRAGLLNVLILPPPSKVAEALYELYVETGQIYWHFFVTIFEALAGFLIGCAIGLALAIGAALSPTFRRYIAPYAVVFNVTPGIAVTPIIIAWFGFGWNSKIALAALVVFFPVFVNTLSGLLQIDTEKQEMFRSLGASRLQTFFKLMLPDAAPMIMAGFKVAITGALTGVIVAEFASATEGVGILMQRFTYALDIASSIAALLTMAVMGLLLFTLMELLDSLLIFWRRDGRMSAVGARRARRFRALI
jgi:NitT/TauT family transport system permease protein